MLETRRRLVDRPCRNHATTDSEPKPARNQTRRELLVEAVCESTWVFSTPVTGSNGGMCSPEMRKGEDC